MCLQDLFYCLILRVAAQTKGLMVQGLKVSTVKGQGSVWGSEAVDVHAQPDVWHTDDSTMLMKVTTVQELSAKSFLPIARNLKTLILNPFPRSKTLIESHPSAVQGVHFLGCS